MPEVPQVTPSPVGQDTPPVAPKETPKPETPPAKPTKQMTQEEYDDIQQKAANFDLIQNDPELATKVVDHFKAKTGRATPQQKPPEAPITPQPNQDDQRFKMLAERQARVEVELFRSKHPDVDTVKDEMARLMNNYSMGLDEAYRLSKAVKAQSIQKPQGTPPTVSSSETKETVGEPDVSDDSYAEVEKRINDPKATPHMDDAIALAFAAAKRKNAVIG